MGGKGILANFLGRALGRGDWLGGEIVSKEGELRGRKAKRKGRLGDR